MPMYDFQCKACGHGFETLAKLDEQPACPECKSADTERLMGAPMITGKAGVHYSTPKEWGTGPGRPKRK